MADSPSAPRALQQRYVVRAALAHIIVAWLFVQIADVVLPYLGITDQPVRWALVVSVATFPVTLFLAWSMDRSSGAGQSMGELLVLLLIAAGAGLWVIDNLPDEARSRTSIVIMPFTHDGTTENKGLSRAIAYEVTSLLTRTRAIDVIAYQSSSAMALQGLGTVAAADRLRVQHVLQGSVSSAGDRMVVELQLLTAAGDTVWATKMDEPINNLLDVQERIASGVEARLGAGDGGQSVKQLVAERCWMPTDPSALQRYYTARYYTELRTGTPESRQQLKDAIRLYKELIEQYPTFAEAYTGLAWAYGYQTTYHQQDAIEGWRKEGEKLANTALEHCATLGEALHLIPNDLDHENGWIGEWQQLTAFADAEPHKPEYSQRLSFHYRMTGLWDKALEVAERNYELNPLSVRTIRELASITQYTGDTERATELYDLSTELGATGPNFARMMGGMFECDKGDLDCFVQNLPPPFRQYEEPFRTIYRIPTDDADGEESLAVAYELLDQAPDMTNWFNGSACEFEHLGPLFFHAWERSKERGTFWFWANTWGECEHVHSAPEFIDYVNDNGFAEYWRVAGWPKECEPQGDSFACGRNMSGR